MMIRIFLGLLLSILINSCTSLKKNHKSNVLKEPFLYSFKLVYFQKLLLEGYNHSTEIKTILSQDKSTGYGEPLLSKEDYKIIDSCAAINNQKMIQDSLQKIGKVSEGMQGKHIFTFALNGFQSKWLDSLAKARFEVYRKKQNNP